MRFHFRLIFIIMVLFVLGQSVYVSSYNKDIKKLVAEAIDNLSHPEFYMALANPTISYVNIPKGMRKEQIADIVATRFKWDATNTEEFLGYDANRDTKFEGKYYPGIYLVKKNISGNDMKETMNSRFSQKFNSIKENASSTASVDTIANIASIIEREASQDDMRLVSGIIWNRLSRGMNLQMDATLQYAKGSEDNGWWPEVSPKDKQIESPYNTYKYNGLPPSPIANPSEAALDAAMNPQKTSCLYYFHKNGQIYCSSSYSEHKRKIDLYLK